MLVVHESARKRFVECMEHAAKHGLLEQFMDKLFYLHTYANGEGCTYDRRKHANTRCTLYEDHAPLSFAFCMEKTELYRDVAPELTEWKPFFGGGFIYQGPGQPADGSAPSFTVSLAEGHGWFTHT